MIDPPPGRSAAFLGGLAWVLVVAGLLAAPPLRNVDWGWQLQTFWAGRPTFYQDLWGLRWGALDERFGFGTLVLADADRPHAPDLPGGEARWRLAYFDDHARIYVDLRAAEGAWAERGFQHVQLRW